MWIGRYCECQNKNYLRNFWALNMQSTYVHVYPSVWGNLEKYCKTITTRSDLIISKSAIIYCWYFSIRASFNEFEGKINLPPELFHTQNLYLRAFMANTTRIYMHDSRELTHFARRMINWCSLCTYRSPRFLFWNLFQL